MASPSRAFVWPFAALLAGCFEDFETAARFDEVPALSSSSLDMRTVDLRFVVAWRRTGEGDRDSDSSASGGFTTLERGNSALLDL